MVQRFYGKNYWWATLQSYGQMHEDDWITDEPLCELCRAELEKTGSELRTCTDCSKPWVFEAGEKQFLEKCAAEAAEDGRNFTMPTRCKPWRERKKRAREEEESAQREEENSDDTTTILKIAMQDNVFDFEHFEEEESAFEFEFPSSDDDGLWVICNNEEWQSALFHCAQ
jgi:hypothetical protein